MSTFRPLSPERCAAKIAESNRAIGRLRERLDHVRTAAAQVPLFEAALARAERQLAEWESKRKGAAA